MIKKKKIIHEKGDKVGEKEGEKVGQI